MRTSLTHAGALRWRHGSGLLVCSCTFAIVTHHRTTLVHCICVKPSSVYPPSGHHLHPVPARAPLLPQVC
jgi:hypothetical protein